MKKIMLICGLFIGMTTALIAQPKKVVTDPVEKAKGLQKELKLSDRQTERVTVIYKESVEKFDKIKVKENGNTNKMLEEVRPLRVATIKKIKNVLTAKQSIKYDKLVKDSQNQGLNGGWSDGWSSASN